METITTLSHDELSQVQGGFGALLGALLPQIGPILQGVTGIIQAAKAGSPGPQPAGAPQAAPASGGGCPGCGG
jgi:bacteriocin-like protein